MSTARYEQHGDGCGWHLHQRDEDCSCGHGSINPAAVTSYRTTADRTVQIRHPVTQEWVDFFRQPRRPALRNDEAIDVATGYQRVSERYPVVMAALGRQSRADSLAESLTNTAIGFVVSLLTWIVVALAYAIPMTWSVNLQITGWFTVVSVARQYLIRRIFNGRTVWSAIKELFR